MEFISSRQDGIETFHELQLKVSVKHSVHLYGYIKRENSGEVAYNS